MPRYQHASYGGESVTLQNNHLRLDVYKRLTGWGWGELSDQSGRFIAVLDHLGELLLRDQEIPMRLEAQSYEQRSVPSGQQLIFHVESLLIKEKLRGTSFENWINYPLTEHAMRGVVTITLDADVPILRLSYRLISQANQYARYVRGPWLKIGQDAFGTQKDDAIFPGVEWLLSDEWSSGTDWFKDPWALRVIPHPNKVAIPLMALSYQQTGIGLAWDPNTVVSQWFNTRQQNPQPVFASPNFVDRRNNHLFGLMIPSVDVESHENAIWADPPLELHPEQRIDFDAEVFLTGGDSLSVVVNWIQRHGLPQPQARWPLPDALDRIARAYDTRFWRDGEGFGNAQRSNGFHPSAPRFLDDYLKRDPESPLALSLRRKLDWCRTQPGFREAPRSNRLRGNRDELLKQGRQLAGYQREDGSFPFDPDGRHWVKDDFVVAREYLEPMGKAHDTALDISITPVIELLTLAEATGEDAFRQAAHRALDYCLPLKRPEGGDFWETPLHSPNLLAAGHAAVAYELGYRAFNDERYRAQAIHWIRSLLPFTHLWQPRNLPMLYNTKPCLCASDWYFANWVRDHVQWEVLETFAQSLHFGIDWSTIDPDIDWRRVQEGVTTAALRWMIDHTEDNWRPHNLPDTLPAYQAGLMDDLFADTHNTTTGNYGGAGIMPDVIAVNILGLLNQRAAG